MREERGGYDRYGIEEADLGLVLFDWAGQPYHTLLVAFFFEPYFASIAAEYFCPPV